MTSIFLYAEVLTNIRQVTLYASVQTAETTDETVLHIASDKKRVTVQEGGFTSGIYLPTEISGTADVTIAKGKKKEISVRLEIGDTSELLPRNDGSTAIEVPWSAQDLTSMTTVQCKQCQATIVASGKVSEWKDLPSENWAEMMDFWHCHKPHDETTNGDAAEAKGYSSKSQLAVFPATGLVDTVSFLLHKSDCTGLKVRLFFSPTHLLEMHGDKKETSTAFLGLNDPSHGTRNIPTDTVLLSQAPKLDASKTSPTLKCKSCSSILGERDPSLSAIKLFKPRLVIQTHPNYPPSSHDATIFINAQLLLSIESLATRKFILHSNTPSNPGLHLWVFNPDIHYSSSATGPTAHRATKIFYRPAPTPQALLDTHATTLEEVVLPSSILEEFTTSLIASTSILPESARSFQEWSVGLLGRYERNPICGMEQQPLANKLGEMPEWPEGVEQVVGIEEMEGHEGLFD